MDEGYAGTTLPEGIRSRLLNANGVPLHVLEAGFENTGRPLVMLVHGFPELAYSWRKQLLPLAQAGFHAAALDLRGYGRSWGTGVAFEDDLTPYAMPNHVSDLLGLVQALGHGNAAAVVGHDFGSSVAAWCALIRPDVFHSLVMMSAPFGGPPPLPEATPEQAGAPDIHSQLAALPRPRKHYQHYYTTSGANENMWRCPQGVHAFLRGYYHYKSADWKENNPSRLSSWTGGELAKMPTYYIMDLGKGMAETVAAVMPSAAEIEACGWLPDDELRVYASEYMRNGFQGGLQNYRTRAESKFIAQLRMFSGRRIDVPSCFIAGASDWGTYQRPGALETMAGEACTKFQGIHLVDGAGHWVQQEQPGQIDELLIDFLHQNQ
ncbi:MAG: alpha/beta hydrolase [Spirochaetales bacterium]|nr:alpha/beta hydrolase [Spirochaetales bacterium]